MENKTLKKKIKEKQNNEQNEFGNGIATFKAYRQLEPIKQLTKFLMILYNYNIRV